MKHKAFLRLGSLLAVALVAASCDNTSVNELLSSAPSIESFSPSEGSIGTEIVITGSDLDDVVSATIGGVPATLSQKVSDKRLSIKVSGEAKSGKIALTNALGTTESEATFTVTYPAPAPNETILPDEVEMGNKLLISGSHMNVVASVVFTAEGHAEGHEAQIITQNEREVVVTVPYVEADDARITFRYYDGTSETTTAPTKVITIKRYQPVVTTTTFAETTVGDVVTLEGTYLDKINSLTLGGVKCVITSQTSSTLNFVVPTSTSFADGPNVLKLEMTYFEGVETSTITDHFVVNVPYIYVWKNKKIYGQGRDVDELTSFFSPETGIAYANSSWRTLDAISYQYQNKTCSSRNVPAVTEAEYNSVPPYFFFSGTSAGLLQINSPAGSNTQLRNFYMINNSADDYRVTGRRDNCYGTPCLAFVYMDPSNAAHADIINRIKNGTLTRIDENSFPIDANAKTIGNISVASVRQSVTNSIYAPGVFPVGADKSADVDAVIMIIYYNYHGQGSNAAENVRRIGFIHLKHVDYKLYNNTNAPSSSAVTFDMYWMKHNYANN